MSNTRVKKYLYLLPYILLLLLGAWYRRDITYAYLSGDACSYLIPVYFKELRGEWHKDFRPMQYLFFVYFTLSKGYGLKSTIIAQQVLSVAGGAFLAAAWITFVRQLRTKTIIWHLAGYVMLGIYISSPVLINYAASIGPESMCIFVMCVLIFCLSATCAADISPGIRVWFMGAAIFINLYLINPMPKCIFACGFLELLLIWMVLKSPVLSRSAKKYALIVPHLLFALLVMWPEYTHQIDRISDDRVYIEFEQMAFTHFDLLARDKNNFNLPPKLQDDLIRCLRNSRQGNEGSLLGFNSDNLMWGDAAQLISRHYSNNDDSIGCFYRHMDYILMTKYPGDLAMQIAEQIGAFFWPNKWLHKSLYGHQDVQSAYDLTRYNALQADSNFSDMLRYRFKDMKGDTMKMDVFSRDYPLSYKQAGFKDMSKEPLLYGQGFWIYIYFDYIYILALAGFIFIRIRRREILKWHVLNILYLMTGIYVATIAIVHTLDVERFITTIYPFILISTFLALAYISDEIWQIISPGALVSQPKG